MGFLDKYKPAFEKFMATGNLAEAARAAEVNENSLREYARRHGWDEERRRAVQSRAEALDFTGAALGKVVSEFYSKPTEAKAKIVRQAIELEQLMGGGAAPEEVQLRGYDGSRDRYREMLMGLLVGATRRGRAKEAQGYAEMLGKLDGHLDGDKGDASASTPDLSPLAGLDGRAA